MSDERVRGGLEALRTARIRRDKVIRFVGEAEDGEVVEWYVAYRGKYGWAACRENGEWMDEPTDEEVETSFEVYDHAELIDRSETPEEVTL